MCPLIDTNLHVYLYLVWENAQLYTLYLGKQPGCGQEILTISLLRMLAVLSEGFSLSEMCGHLSSPLLVIKGRTSKHPHLSPRARG